MRFQKILITILLQIWYSSKIVTRLLSKIFKNIQIELLLLDLPENKFSFQFRLKGRDLNITYNLQIENK